MHVPECSWLAFEVFGALGNTASFLSSLFLLCIVHVISLLWLKPNRMLYYNEFCRHLVTLTALFPPRLLFSLVYFVLLKVTCLNFAWSSISNLLQCFPNSASKYVKFVMEGFQGQICLGKLGVKKVKLASLLQDFLKASNIHLEGSISHMCLTMEFPLQQEITVKVFWKLFLRN